MHQARDLENIVFNWGRPDEPAILISTLLLRMRGTYIARSWPDLCGFPLRINGLKNAILSCVIGNLIMWKLGIPPTLSNQRNGIWLRARRESFCQILLLLCGDVETCPGLVTRCGSCNKSLRNSQSRISCSLCQKYVHLRCFDSNEEVSCSWDVLIPMRRCLVLFVETSMKLDKKANKSQHKPQKTFNNTSLWN